MKNAESAQFTRSSFLSIFLQVPTYPAEPLLNSSDNSSTSNSSAWWNQEVTVLGKAKWTMSFTHFVLLFAIFHIVYGTIAAICDLMFFHTLVKQTVRVRYVSTVLPVHRLFFVVICWIDGVLFVTSTNITALIDPWAVALVFLAMVAATVDTALVLASLKAVQDKPAPIFMRPWRNAGLVSLLLLNALYTVVFEYLGGFTWEAGPSLILIALSLILLLTSLWHTLRGSGEEVVPLDRTVNFFLCVSGSNVLGLFSVGALLHRLLLRTEFDSF